nr:hypothetical protein [Bradyrhizobium sp. CCBAU 051011]
MERKVFHRAQAGLAFVIVRKEVMRRHEHRITVILGSPKQGFQVGIHVVLLHQLLDHDEIFAAVSEEVVLDIDKHERGPIAADLHIDLVLEQHLKAPCDLASADCAAYGL